MRPVYGPACGGIPRILGTVVYCLAGDVNLAGSFVFTLRWEAGRYEQGDFLGELGIRREAPVLGGRV